MIEMKWKPKSKDKNSLYAIFAIAFLFAIGSVMKLGLGVLVVSSLVLFVSCLNTLKVSIVLAPLMSMFQNLVFGEVSVKVFLLPLLLLLMSLIVAFDESNCSENHKYSLYYLGFLVLVFYGSFVAVIKNNIEGNTLISFGLVGTLLSSILSIFFGYLYYLVISRQRPLFTLTTVPLSLFFTALAGSLISITVFFAQGTVFLSKMKVISLNPNAMSFGIEVFFLLGFREYSKLTLNASLKVLFCAIPIIALILLVSRGAWLAFLLFFIVRLLCSAKSGIRIKRSRFVILLVLVSLFSWLFGGQIGLVVDQMFVQSYREQGITGLVSFRNISFEAGIDIARSNLLFGIGHNYSTELSLVSQAIGRTQNIHNTYLEVLAHFGMLGAFTYIFFLFSLAKVSLSIDRILGISWYFPLVITIFFFLATSSYMFSGYLLIPAAFLFSFHSRLKEEI